MLDTLAGTIALKRSGIAAANQSYADWQGAESRKRVEEQNLQARNTEIELCNENLRIAVAELERAALEHQSAKSTLAVYQEAAGAIRAAVSTVAEKLAIGTDNCPVCLEPHGEQMLRRRIADALNAMDPRLSEATAALRLAAEKLEMAQKSKDGASAALITTQALRARVKEAIAAIESEIKVARSIILFVGLELAEVQKRLDSLQAEVDCDRSELDSKRVAQEPSLSVDAMTEVSARFNYEKRELAEFEEALARLDETIKDTTAALAEHSLLVTEDVTIEEVERALS
ncbi:hypothetical protein, partial [Undibacterium luofuense]|uniref:hypothetical protein n=1 Tax=Undibacterium luofuense TaxID=2828733 RepID=UPI0030EB705C